MFSHPGTVWLQSESNPRWDVTIRVECLVFSAGMPNELKFILEKEKQCYGEPPDDLMWGGMKD